MTPEEIGWIRSLFQHKLNVHPVWGNPEQIEALKVFFDFDDDDIETLNTFGDWIASHGLERLFPEYYKDNI